jgi:hypothetical protein
MLAMTLTLPMGLKYVPLYLGKQSQALLLMEERGLGW